MRCREAMEAFGRRRGACLPERGAIRTPRVRALPGARRGHHGFGAEDRRRIRAEGFRLQVGRGQVVEQGRRLDERIVLEQERRGRHATGGETQEVHEGGPGAGDADAVVGPAEPGEEERGVEQVSSRLFGPPPFDQAHEVHVVEAAVAGRARVHQMDARRTGPGRERLAFDRPTDGRREVIDPPMEVAEPLCADASASSMESRAVRARRCRSSSGSPAGGWTPNAATNARNVRTCWLAGAGVKRGSRPSSAESAASSAGAASVRSAASRVSDVPADSVTHSSAKARSRAGLPSSGPSPTPGPAPAPTRRSRRYRLVPARSAGSGGATPWRRGRPA